jgi:hypothetical protein
MAGRQFFKKAGILILLLAIAGSSALLITRKVNAVERDAEKALESCEALAYREQCYAKAFGNLTKSTNLTHAFDVLRALQQVDSQARGCHFIAHSISIAETEKAPERWREVMNAAPQDCSYGAVHGPLEYYASTFPDGRIPKDQIGTLCNNPDTNNCSHGLGHILLVVNGNNIDESASDCEALPHSQSSRFECLTGVFMERITALNLELHGLAGKEALNWPARVPELEALCQAQTGTRSIACWREIVHAVLVKFGNDFQRTVDFCETAPGEEETRNCIDHALGINTGAYDFEIERMKTVCDVKVKAENFKSRCYPHLVSATLSTRPSEAADARRFCSELDLRYVHSCLTAIDNFERGKSATRSVNFGID